MAQNEQCNELTMFDVIRIDIMPSTVLQVGIPFNVRNIADTSVTMANGDALTDQRLYAGSLLSLNFDGGNTADAGMGEGLTHKVSEKRGMSGVVRTHTLQIPIEFGFQTIRERQDALQQTDFHIVLTTNSGTRYLAYGLPNTSQFGIADQMGQTAQMTLSVVVQSMSGFIEILD